MNPHELSREYYRFVSNFTKTDFENQKLLGQFYTDFQIAESMMKIITKHFQVDCFTNTLKIIDPFCGDGRLVIKLLSHFLQAGLFPRVQLFISLWDIDPEAVKNAENITHKFCSENNIQCQIDARAMDAFVEYKSYSAQYDICVTNPPWSLLKPQKILHKNNDDEELVEYSNVLEQYDAYMKHEFQKSQPSSKFGKWGTNLARCGTEVAIKMIKRDGICGIVSPASLMNDQVSNNLRKWIFEDYQVINISYYPAELKLYGSADISSVTFVLQHGQTCPDLDLRIYSDRDHFISQKLEKAVFEYIQKKEYRIPLKTGFSAVPIMMYLEQLPTTDAYCTRNSLSFTRELDETRIKEKLQETGNIEFAKGYMVDRYKFNGEKKFVDEDKVAVPLSANCAKLVWRDVSRDSQKRRIKATLLSPGYICGNSLGVIFSKNINDQYLKQLLAVMNSLIFEYQARGMLVSNHVSAGIIKQIHVPQFELNKDLVRLVDMQLNGENVELQIELAVAIMYGISIEHYKSILDCFNLPLEDKTFLLNRYMIEVGRDGNHTNMIYNHYAATLSALDMQVIKCVPPGGNWKDIPENVPSKRLEQIREGYKAGKGSRSTYYGRLRADMPSYTINTYFNRPGNGCHMHYSQDRTLSQREAARFQSFPDSFEFIGSLGAINNQIGNAVPPLLAYQIAKKIPFKGQFVDLFCGAGGLALGFTWAGWTPIIGNDIDKYAIETHKRNIPGDAIAGDINDPVIYNQIVEKALEARKLHPDRPLFVLGGPPCQGFSTANTRRGADDMRNWLFKAYVKIVEMIQPDGFVFENVRGILNLDKGKFFEMIQSELKESIEEIKVIQVHAAHFGVPQRRDRVIILGGNKELLNHFTLEEISCVPKDGQLSILPPVIGAEDVIGDLPPLNPGENGSNLEYRFPAANAYQKFMRGEIPPEEYLNMYKLD